MSLVFAAAAVETAHAAESSGVLKLLGDFGIQPSYVVMQLVSFAILAFVLYKFAIKPITATIDERTGKIEAGLKFAEDMKAQLAAAQQENAALIKAAQVEANKIIDEARKTAKDFSEKSQAEATERAKGLITKAQQAIELEHKKMLADARGEIARLVVTTTERVLAKKLTDADRASYNETAARELASV